MRQCGWVRTFLTDPAVLADGLKTQQAKREKDNAPRLARLEVLDDLLADHRLQLDRLFDLYLTGDFPKEVLTERRARLQTTIDALEQERIELAAPLDEQTITNERIEGILDYAKLVAKGIEAAEHDFDKRRLLIEALDVRVRLTVEGDEQVAYARCLLGDTSLSLANFTIPATISPTLEE